MSDTYLITGCAGFIGANLVRYLMYNSKCRIIGVDRLDSITSMNNVYVNKLHEFQIGDCSDVKFMHRVFSLYKPTKVIHLATPNNDFLNEKIKNLETMLSLSSFFSVSSFAYVSSDQVYDPNGTNAVETDRLVPHNKIAIEKTTTENLITKSQLPYIIFRTPELFGPRQFNGFIPNLIRGFEEGEIRYIEDGQKVRDLLYVDDLCDAILKTPCNRSIYNISINNDFYDFEIASMINSKEECLIKNNYYSQDLSLINMNTDKIKETGWKPLKKFRERLKFTTFWYNNNKWALTSA